MWIGSSAAGGQMALQGCPVRFSTSWFEAPPGLWLLETLPCSTGQELGAVPGSASAGLEPLENKYCLGEQGALRDL